HPDFPVQYLRLGVFSLADGAPLLGTALGRFILDRSAGSGEGVLAAALAPALSSVIVTVIPERGQCPDAVEDAYLRAGLPVAVVDDPKDALQHAIDGAGAGDIILITGSFYLAEAMRMYLPHGWTPAISTLSA
ncbi:MAG: glutamate ligase domain-containing protein, partial [Armatimonadota bacterium]